jgi:hypothetical protein
LGTLNVHIVYNMWFFYHHRVSYWVTCSINKGEKWKKHLGPLQQSYSLSFDMLLSLKHSILKFLWLTTIELVGSFWDLEWKLAWCPILWRVLIFFPFQLLGSFSFFFLTSKLDVQCMVMVKKEQTQFCFKTFLNWRSINILNNVHLVGEGHFKSYFYKKLKSYKVFNGSKSKMCLYVVVGYGNWNTKLQPTLTKIWNQVHVVPIIIFIYYIWVNLILFLKNLNFETSFK